MTEENKTRCALYQFDGVTVDCAKIRVHKNGQNIVLTPRAFDVLAFLLKNSGRLVEKHELFDAVWKERFVSDNALTKIIKEIRRALGDPADQPRYIETLPKRGYRFRGPVSVTFVSRTEEGNGKPQDWASRFVPIKRMSLALVSAIIGISAVFTWYFLLRTAARPSSIRSVAVLPFKPLSNDSHDESFELGMAEALITRLNNLRQITVRPISSVRKYTDPLQDAVNVGREIQVESVLDGSIQKVGDRIRVTVRMTDVGTGVTQWSEQFDENITDIFKVQNAIAERVTNAFAIELTKAEKEQLSKSYTSDPEALELYLQAQVIWHGRRPKWLDQSMEFFRRALDKDPNFAMAYIGLANCYTTLAANRTLKSPEAGAKALPLITKALEIDPSLAQAHNALAEFKYQGAYDWAGAEKEFKTAIELNPNVANIHAAYGWFLMSEARFDEAQVEIDTARTLDPSSLNLSVIRGKFLYYSRQYDLALQQFQNVLALEPNDVSSHFFLFTIYEEKQMYPEGIEHLLKFMSMSGQQPPEIIEELRQVFNSAGRQEFFRRHLEIVETQAQSKSIDPVRLAGLNIRLGDTDQAFRWLEKTFEAHDPSMIQFKIDPANDGLRSDPRYGELVRKIGLQP